MKPLPRSSTISGFHRGVRLYRDDLEHILGIMSDAGLSTKITDSRSEYESLEEVEKTQGNSPRELKIEGSRSLGDRGPTLELSDRVWYFGSFDKQNYGLAQRTEEILKTRQSFVQRLPLFWVNSIAIATIYFSTQLVGIPKGLSITLFSIGTAIFVPIICLWLYSFLRAGVVLKYRHEAGFIARNRDKIIVAICTTIGLAALQLLIQFFTGKEIQLFGP